MSTNSTGSFFTRLREKFFKRRLSWEIHDQMFPHLRQEGNYGYSFTTEAEMNAQTGQLDAAPLLATIESQIREMPKAYGECFRHVLHRDLRHFLARYEHAARRAVRPKECDPRLVATHWEPVQR
jgi:hypothetical protein